MLRTGATISFCWVCNRPVFRDMKAFMLWLIPGVLTCWWGYAWRGHSDNWALKNLSTGIEASVTEESLNGGDQAVHPAARHKAQKRESRPRWPPQLRTPRRHGSQRTGSRKFNDMPLMPVHTAFIAAAQTVVHGAVPHRFEGCSTFENRLSQQVMMFEQHPPYYVQRRSRASWHRCLFSSKVWSASCVGPLATFSSAGRRFYRRWTLHQCWCCTSTVDSFSYLSVCCCLLRAMTCILRPCFPQKHKNLLVSVYITRALRGRPLWRPAASLVGCMRCQVL